MKDNFSVQAEDYARYRPSYPPELFQFIYKHVPAFGTAWDCATGNGQIAIKLAEKFKNVIATDISQKQLLHAAPHPSINYFTASAEASGIESHSCDLVTVGQAIHWFQFDDFYKEVKRVSRKDALLVLAGYDLPVLPDAINSLVLHFYNDVLGPYWDPERRYIDEQYRSLPFPFEELPAPEMSCNLNWTLEQMAGFIGTWSALQHYRNAKNDDPFPEFVKRLKSAWPENDVFPISFPILIKAAIVA